MKKIFFALGSVMLFMLTAAANTVTFPGIKFINSRTSVKDMGNGVYEVTFPAGKGWPLIQIIPDNMPAQRDTVNITIQQIAPKGSLSYRIRLAMEPGNTSPNLQMTQILRDNKPHNFEIKANEGKKMTHFSIAAHMPDKEIKLLISNIKVTNSSTVKKAVKPLPPVMFKGKPMFPVGAWDFGDRQREYPVDPGLLAAGANMAEIGVMGLPGHPWYEKHRQPVLFANLKNFAQRPEYAHIAWLVGITYELYTDASQANKNSYFIPLSGAELERRKAILKADLQKLSKYDNIIGYQIDEPENTFYEYYSKHFKNNPEKVKDAGLSAKMVEWTKWMNDSIRENHPNAKLMPVMGWWTTYLNASSMYDINFPNGYPHPNDIAQVNYDAAKAVKAARDAGNGKTAVYMPAMFDYLPGRTIYTREQVRYACFTPITRGVMGVYGWRLHRSSQEYRDRVIYPTLREISNLTDYFLGSWHDELVSSDHDRATVDYLQKFQERVREVDGKEDAAIIRVIDAVPDVTYCLRYNKKNGKYLLLVTNNRRDSVKVKFVVDLPNMPPVLVDAIDYHQVRVSKNQFTDTFAPHGVHAYIIEQVKK